MSTDRRSPGVYVSIEDVSYVAPPFMVGRSVYCVGVCPQGPHNRVVEVTSQSAFHKTFGQPNFYKTSMSHYIMDKAMQLTGRGLYVRIVPDDAKQSQSIIKKSGATAGDLVSTITGTFEWENSTTVTVNTDVSDDLKVGDWIFSTEETETGVNFSKQIVGLEVNSDNNTEIILDSVYTGTFGSSTNAYKYSPYIVVSGSGFNATDQIPTQIADVAADVLYQVIAIGAGEFYNKYKIRGFRNVELEKMFTDDDGEVKYKYLFMDIGVYRVNDDGSETLMEGPWTVSLTNTVSTGQKIRDLSSGQPLFIQTVINNRSELIRICAGAKVQELNSTNLASAEILRRQIMMILSSGTPAATNFVVGEEKGVQLSSGSDGTTNGNGGTPLYDPNTGNIYIDEYIEGLAAQAYNGSLTSTDGSIEQLREVIYPVYQPDYIISGNWSAFVQNAARQLADFRQDCHHLADCGVGYKHTDDLNSRQSQYSWNNWTSSLYTQFRRRRDEYTGEMITISPIYHAIERHLIVDNNYFLGEPPAGIEKGAITEPIELLYKANHTERGDLGDKELNLTISEPDGIYFLTQFTTWKRLSILKRQHAAKFVSFIRKMVPSLLKDLLQRKATPFWINQANMRVTNLLNKFQGGDVEALNVLESFSVNVDFDDISSELNVRIQLKPLRVIERINVYISVA
jgi:hypothetical protein